MPLYTSGVTIGNIQLSQLFFFAAVVSPRLSPFLHLCACRLNQTAGEFATGPKCADVAALLERPVQSPR
eukprot:SAG31_NODE_721_length_12587_cov_5.502002_5_plen_69_part_00